MLSIKRKFSPANEKSESSLSNTHHLWHIVNISLIASGRFFAIYPSFLVWSYVTAVLSSHFFSSCEWNNNGAASWVAPKHTRRVSLCFGYTGDSAAESHVAPTVWGGKHEKPLRNVQRSMKGLRAVQLCAEALFVAANSLYVYMGEIEGLSTKLLNFFLIRSISICTVT